MYIKHTQILIYTYIYMIIRNIYVIYYEELAHVIIEAKKSHNMLYASCIPRKPVIQSEAKGLGTKGGGEWGGAGLSHGVQRPKNQEI